MPPANAAIFPASAATISDLLNQHDAYATSTQPTLAAAIASTDTSFSVATGTGAIFPTDNFVCTIDEEIIFVAARVSDTFSGCVRGSQGTTAAAHSSGATVDANITAWHHNQNAAEIIALESWKFWRTHPDRPPVTANAMDDEFDNDGSSFDPKWTVTGGATGVTLSIAQSVASWYIPAGNGGTARIYQAAPTPPWSFAWKYAANCQSNYAQLLTFFSGPSSTYAYIGLDYRPSWYFVHGTTASGEIDWHSIMASPSSPWIWGWADCTSTTLTLYQSLTPFKPAYAEYTINTSTALGGDPTTIELRLSNNTNTPGINGILEWFRRLA